jgi:hypothetical protein
VIKTEPEWRFGAAQQALAWTETRFPTKFVTHRTVFVIRTIRHRFCANKKEHRIAPVLPARTLPQVLRQTYKSDYCSGLSLALAVWLTLKRITPDWSLKKCR